MFALSIGPWEGTHQRIDRWALASLPEQPFPELATILQYEGMGAQAPDGASLIYNSTISRNSYHYYNPQTREGGAIARVRRYWSDLVRELDRPYSRRAARAAAWLAHFTTDTLSPAHHAGHFIAPPQTGPNLWYRDWYDPYWDALPAWQRLSGPHALFELRIVLETPLRYRPFECIECIECIGTDIPSVRTEDDLQSLLEREALAIAELEIYSRFIAEGWTPKVRAAILEQVLPRQSALIAGLWQSAVAVRSLRPGPILRGAAEANLH